MTTAPGDLTIDEMAALTSGADAWQTKAIDRLGIPAVRLADGPHGLRVEREGDDVIDLSNSYPATCFPPAVALGSTGNAGLVSEVGAALGVEAAALGVGVLLGPGINIKRSPLCGRNFEYLSEDPHLTGVLGAAYVRGIQSTGVGAAIKHFAANNQETDRMRVNVDVDERAMREIYLRDFETIVRTEKPWMLMSSYNFVNGVAMSENKRLLTDVLRSEWGFDGVVVSDWGAVYDRVRSIAAGLDLEMPTSSDEHDREVVAAIEDGSLDPADLALSAGRVLLLAARVGSGVAREVDFDAHDDLAMRAAVEAAVLLKNENGVLPIDPNGTSTIAVIGDFAVEPRFQGAGSSQVKATMISDALSAITELAGDGVDVRFAPGFRRDEDTLDQSLLAEAVAAVQKSDVAVVFLGLPEHLESEGFDRSTLELPAAQVELLSELRKTSARIVVVLSNGGVIATSAWATKADAILEGWLLGQAGGRATARLLFGFESPSGRLAETVPMKLEDTPSFHNFPGYNGVVRYGEGVFVGYRHYDTVSNPVAYPFGFGLSYTSFDLAISGVSVRGAGGELQVLVKLTVTNTGQRAGSEVAQVYVAPPPGTPVRPAHELVAFRKVFLQPGEVAGIEIELDARGFSYWDERTASWTVATGPHGIQLGASSRDIRATQVITVSGHERVAPLGTYSTLLEWQQHPAGTVELSAMRGVDALVGENATVAELTLRMLENIPLVKLAQLFGFDLSVDDMEAAVRRANATQTR
jgi:beta-glucosidase